MKIHVNLRTDRQMNSVEKNSLYNFVSVVVYLINYLSKANLFFFSFFGK